MIAIEEFERFFDTMTLEESIEFSCRESLIHMVDAEIARIAADAELQRVVKASGRKQGGKPRGTLRRARRKTIT